MILIVYTRQNKIGERDIATHQQCSGHEATPTLLPKRVSYMIFHHRWDPPTLGRDALQSMLQKTKFLSKKVLMYVCSQNNSPVEWAFYPPSHTAG